jgi:virulence factor
MNVVRVGVVGLGRMGQQHCRVYSSLRHAQLVGVHDANFEVGIRVARKFEVPYYPRLEDLLAAVDAISLATPTPSHFEIAKRCLEQGLHLLVEKPITQTIEQAEALVSIAEASGLTVQVGHIERFNPAYIELRNVIEEMQVVAINMRRLSAYAGSNTDVNVVLDLMIHDADLALDLIAEEPSSVNARGVSVYGEAVDHAVAQLSFPSGRVLSLSASRVTEEKIRSIEVTAHEAYIETNLLSKTVTIHRRSFGEYLNNSKRGVKYRQESLIESILVPVVEPLHAELQHFIDCIVEKKPTQVPPRDGLRALRLAQQICDLICENPATFRLKDMNVAPEFANLGVNAPAG